MQKSVAASARKGFMKMTFKPVMKLVVALWSVTLLPGCLDAADPTANGQSADTPNNPPAVKIADTASANATTDTNSVAMPAIPPTLPKLSPGLAEVITLAQSRVGDEVLLAYIQNSKITFSPSVEEVVYLHDLGVSDKVIAAMMQHGKDAPQSTNTTAVASVTTNTPPLVDTNAVTPLAATAPVYATPPEIVSAPTEVNYFYPELSPYGSWYLTTDYGWCWQPSVAIIDVGWQPYCDSGRWLWTDCGWYWQSDYSWGWAAFHYGRWFRDHHRGWVWAPDNCWGPAWVSWRYSPNYCGWAPLPPSAHFRPHTGFTYFNASVGVDFEFGLHARDYTFVRSDRFYLSNPRPYFAPASQSTRLYNQTTVVNHVVTGNNNQVIVSGVPVDHIASVSRTEIQKVQVQDFGPAHRPGVRPDRLVQEGASVAIYRPVIQSGAGAHHVAAPNTTLPRSDFSAGANLTRPQVPQGVAPVGTRPDVRNSASTQRPGLINQPLAKLVTPGSNFQFPSLQRPSAPRTEPAAETHNATASPTTTLFNPIGSRGQVTVRQEPSRETKQPAATRSQSIIRNDLVERNPAPPAATYTPPARFNAPANGTTSANEIFGRQQGNTETPSVITPSRQPRYESNYRNNETPRPEIRSRQENNNGNYNSYVHPNTRTTPEFRQPPVYTPRAAEQQIPRYDPPSYSRPSAPAYTPPAVRSEPPSFSRPSAPAYTPPAVRSEPPSFSRPSAPSIPSPSNGKSDLDRRGR